MFISIRFLHLKQHVGEGKGLEWITFARIELRLELHPKIYDNHQICGVKCALFYRLINYDVTLCEILPMQTQGMQKSRQSLHDEQHCNRQHGPRRKQSRKQNGADVARNRKSNTENHGPEHIGQFWIKVKVKKALKSHCSEASNAWLLPAWAKLRAQSRRYDAVWEMQPRQNSMVWIAEWTKTSMKSNCGILKLHNTA